MFSHIMIGTNDLDRAKTFYDKALGALGVPPAMVDGHRIFYMTPGGVFSVSKPINGEAATAPNGGTIGFAATSSELVRQFHAAALSNEGVSEGAPGVRGMPNLYAAYVRDPDGNKICAIYYRLPSAT